MLPIQCALSAHVSIKGTLKGRGKNRIKGADTGCLKNTIKMVHKGSNLHKKAHEQCFKKMI